MSIDVLAIKTPEGWILQTTDEYKDTLAGPFKSTEDAETEAISLDLSILNAKELAPVAVFATPIKTRKKRIPNLTIGDLFRVDTYWYRLKGVDAKNCSVEVVGEGRNTTLPSSTEVTAVSVLSMH